MGSKSIQGRAGFDVIFGVASEGVREIGGALRTVVLSLDPDAVEVAYPGYRTVNYGAGGTGLGSAHCYLMPLKNRVNLGFFNGATLPDPDALMEGDGKSLRHIKVATIDLARDARLAGAIARAIDHERTPAKAGG